MSKPVKSKSKSLSRRRDAMKRENPEQFYCINGKDGVEWQTTASMPSYDRLPKKVRQAFAQSLFNICPVCFGAKTAQIKKLHPDWTRQQLMLAAIEVRENEIRNGMALQCQ